MSLTEESAELDVSNVGGIEETSITVQPGVTVLAGRNASNRTSLLQAVAAALGSDHASLKSDADSGSVTLRVDGETYTRTLERVGGDVVTGGEPYLDDSEVADLFAFLFSWNEARRAVVQRRDLREVIMRPVDTDRLQAEIDRLRAERERVEAEIDELDRLARELPELEQRRRTLREKIDDRGEDLSEAREELASVDPDPDGQREAELDRRLEELNELRSELESVEFRLDSERDSLESLREERAELRASLEDLSRVPDGRIGELDREIERLRERKRSLESTVGQLDRIVEFNDEMIDGGSDVLEAPGGAVTDRLLEEGSVTCWTCGSEVERGAIAETIDRLRDLRRDRMDERADVESELAALKEEHSDLESTRAERQRIEDRLDRIEDEIADREDQREELRARRERLESDVEAVEADVEELRADDREVVVRRQRAVTELEFELDELETELSDLESEIERKDRRLAEREDLKQRREQLNEDLTEARTRIERIEREAVEAFNTHVDNLIGILDYDNLERVWIERSESGGRETRFDLHVVRTSEDGAAYEDTTDNLSESEREVVGLVFALAGYLAHEVHETVPFVLLDSLEAIDAERIAAVVDYFREYADYLVVALLPEDARPVEADHRVSEI